MAEPTIICPFCNREIPLTDAISHQIREEIRREFEIEVKKREEEARKKAEEKISLELKDLQEHLKEKEQKLQELQRTELELRKERRELEERQKGLELELARKLDEEREKIRQETLKTVSEEYHLKDLEKDKKISDMLQQIEDLKRRAEQGPIQLKGEVLEMELEDILKDRFPMDQIEPVAKGKRGADVLQRVRNQFGQECGSIIWEAKRTKGWSDGWIDKLKEDQREAKAEVSVLVTTAMPKGVEHFELIDGVWVTNYTIFPCLAMALRTNIIQVSNERKAAEGKQEKMEALYTYLVGPEFRQKVDAIARAFFTMRNDLESEKAAMNRIWAKREKQIDRVITNVACLYGDMQGIIGSSLPEIKSLEFKNLTKPEETDF